jgi:hypothetical protein
MALRIERPNALIDVCAGMRRQPPSKLRRQQCLYLAKD